MIHFTDLKKHITIHYITALLICVDQPVIMSSLFLNLNILRLGNTDIYHVINVIISSLQMAKCQLGIMMGTVYSIVWGLWCQRQIIWTWVSKHIPQKTAGCNYLSMSSNEHAFAVFYFVVVWLSQCQRNIMIKKMSNICQQWTCTKHNRALTMCIILEMYYENL